MGSERCPLQLFETMRAKETAIYRIFAVSILVGISLIWIYRAVHIPEAGEDGRWARIGMLVTRVSSQKMALQILLCGISVIINLPLYKGLLLRTDKGKLPKSLAVKSMVFAPLACFSFELVHYFNQFLKFLVFALFLNDLPLM